MRRLVNSAEGEVVGDDQGVAMGFKEGRAGGFSRWDTLREISFGRGSEPTPSAE